MDPLSIISAFVVGGGIQAVYQRFTSYRLATRQQTDNQTNKLIDHLLYRMDGLEKSHAKCMEDHVAKDRKLDIMQGRLDELSDLSTKTALAMAPK